LTPTPPESIHRRFSDALEARDIDGLTAIYDSEAVFVPPGAEPVRGIEAIRNHLAEMLESDPKLDSETILAVRSGDTAMLRARWSLTYRSPDGQIVTDQGESTEIVRLQSDGTWRCIIDCPYS
jgi:uncharacterized protein (TIGR02246 family)